MSTPFSPQEPAQPFTGEQEPSSVQPVKQSPQPSFGPATQDGGTSPASNQSPASTNPNLQQSFSPAPPLAAAPGYSPQFAPVGQPPAVAQAVKKKPGIWGVIVGIALIVLGLGVGIALMVTSLMGAVSPVVGAKAYSTGAAASYATVQAKAGQQMGIWAKPRQTGLSSQTGQDGFCLAAAQTDPDRLIRVQEAPANSSFYVDDYYLSATFTAPKAGTYMVKCLTQGKDFSYAVAPAPDVSKFVGGLVGGLVVLFFGFVGGLVLLIVTLVRRSRWKRRHMVAPAFAGRPGFGTYGAPTPQSGPTTSPVTPVPTTAAAPGFPAPAPSLSSSGPEPPLTAGVPAGPAAPATGSESAAPAVPSEASELSGPYTQLDQPARPNQAADEQSHGSPDAQQ